MCPQFILYIMIDSWLCISEEDQRSIRASQLRSKQPLIFQWANVISSRQPLPVVCHSDIHALKFVDQGYNWKLGH